MTDDQPIEDEPINARLDDDEGFGGHEDDEEQSFDKKKVLMFVVLPLILLASIGGGLYFTGVIGGGSDGKAEHASAGESGDAHGKKSKKKDSHAKKDSHGNPVSGSAHFLEIPDMVVNISSDGGQPRYLRLGIQLELESMDDKVSLEAVMPRVVDQFQTYLRELRVKDLQGSQGIYRLQMELLSRVNVAAYPVEVRDVLFQEILIQ